ncbi:MAG: PKD domain-containing protein, partial [Luteibaculum sp.]
MLNHLYTLIFFLGVCSAYGQCPQFFDNSGNLSSQPVWKFCDDAASTLNIQSDQNLGNYTVNWGDGNTSNGNSLPAGQILSHNYAAGIQTYTVTITTGGCTIEGTYIKELPVKASIEVPPNGVTQVCAPGSMDFLNNSTGNSPNTTYFWDFGDGQTLGPLGSGNAGQTVTHTYQAGTVDCDTRVTLIAENECSTRPSEATFEPVQIWDIDKPGLGANPTLLCWPDNTVTYTNNTDRNCSRPEEGNTFQRYERWIFHDFFGPGQDSIIDWRPWPPSPPRTVSYPGPGTYDVTLQVRNFCGDAEITRSITIIDEPEALFSLDKDTVCAGQEVTLTKLTGAPANRFRFTTGEGGWSNFGNQNSRTFSYTSPGNYTVGFAIDVNNGTPACKDTAYLPIVVLDDPTADFSISANEGCESLSVSITNQSQDAISWVWDYGNGFTFTGQNPPDVLYNQPGTYTLSLTCTNAKGCTSTFSREINVYSNPEPDFNDGAACLGQEYVFNGEANADPNDPVTSWTWDFGDGIDGNGQNVNHIYFQDGPKIVTLEVETENCSASISKTIDIESLPVASYTPDPSVG